MGEKMSDGNEKQLFGVKEVSVAVSLGTSTIWRQVSADTVPAPIKNVGRTQWRRSDIEAIFASPEAE